MWLSKLCFSITFIRATLDYQLKSTLITETMNVTIRKPRTTGVSKDADVDLLIKITKMLPSVTICKPGAASLCKDADVGVDSQLWEIVRKVPAKWRLLSRSRSRFLEMDQYSIPWCFYTSILLGRTCCRANRQPEENFVLFYKKVKHWAWNSTLKFVKNQN